MNELNVWKPTLRVRYILTHPKTLWRWFRSGIIGTYQRMTRGYARFDWYDMDCHLCTLIPAMLREFADNTMSTPYEFADKPEEWSHLLRHIARLIECWCGITDPTEEKMPLEYEKWDKEDYKTYQTWAKAEADKMWAEIINFFTKYGRSLWD